MARVRQTNQQKEKRQLPATGKGYYGKGSGKSDKIKFHCT